MSCWWKNVHDLCRTLCLMVVSQQELRTFLVEFLVSGTITHGIKSTPIAREEHLRWRCYIAWGNRNNFFDKWSKWNEMSSSVDNLHYYFLFWNYFELWYKVGRVSAWILTFGANQSFHTEILLPYAIAISWAIKSTFGSFMKNHIRKYWKVWFAYGKSQYFGLSNDAESVYFDLTDQRWYPWWSITITTLDHWNGFMINKWALKTVLTKTRETFLTLIQSYNCKFIIWPMFS